MDNTRNVLILVTTVGAIILGLGTFLFNAAYDGMLEDIVIGINKFSKSSVIIIIFSIAALIGDSLVFNWIEGSAIHKSNQNSHINYYGRVSNVMLMSILILIIVYLIVFKLKVINIINNKGGWHIFVMVIASIVVLLAGMEM